MDTTIHFNIFTRAYFVYTCIRKINFVEIDEMFKNNILLCQPLEFATARSKTIRIFVYAYRKNRRN